MDLGCGSGLGAKIALTSIINHPVTYVAIDISTEMIKLIKKKFEGSEFELNKNNQVIESQS